MKDRLHEIIAQIAVFHKELIKSEKIRDLEYVYELIENYDSDVKEHYLGLLMQYYFKSNDLKNLQALLLEGYKFDLRFEDVKDAFINIKDETSVIEFFEDQVALLKDVVIDEHLICMHEYYENNKSIQKHLNFPLEIIKKNRYICSFAYKHDRLECSDFFINIDLLDSIKRDLNYLLK